MTNFYKGIFHKGMHDEKPPRAARGWQGLARVGRMGHLLARVALAVLAVLLITEFDAVWEFLQESLGVLFDFIEENLEAFFTKVMHLELHRAQMAAAYVYFTVLLAAGLPLLRTLARLSVRAKNTGFAWWRLNRVSIARFWRRQRIRFENWWETLDWLNKLAVVVGITLAVIPLVLLLSLGLGMVVAEFF